MVKEVIKWDEIQLLQKILYECCVAKRQVCVNLKDAMESAKSTILSAPMNAQGLHRVSEALEFCFGSNIVRQALVDEGNDTRLARENKSLYVDGLTGGLKTTPSQTTKKVGGHTFFGN